MNLRSKMWKAWREYQYLRWLAYVASVLVPMLSLAGAWLWRRAAELAASAPEFSGGDETWDGLSKAAGTTAAAGVPAVPLWALLAPLPVVLLLCVLLWPQPKPKVPKDGKGPRRFPEEEAAKAKRACHGRCSADRCWGWGRDAGSARANCCMCSRGRRAGPRRRTTRWRCAGGMPRRGSGG